MFCFVQLRWEIWWPNGLSPLHRIPFFKFWLVKLNYWYVLAIRCYWGYCFESLATEDPRRSDGEGIHHVDANVEYCSVIKTKLGAHRILMGAEMDCCDSTDDGRRFYVELKTSREVDEAPAYLHLTFPLLPALFSQFYFFFKNSLYVGFNNKFSMMQLEYHTEEKYEREKLLKFWVNLIPSYAMNLYAFHSSILAYLFHLCAS